MAVSDGRLGLPKWSTRAISDVTKEVFNALEGTYSLVSPQL